MDIPTGVEVGAGELEDVASELFTSGYVFSTEEWSYRLRWSRGWQSWRYLANSRVRICFDHRGMDVPTKLELRARELEDGSSELLTSEYVLPIEEWSYRLLQSWG
jgi:hypothetical protein